MQTPDPGSFFPLGLYPHGDWGPFTIYTTKNRRVVRFPRSPPLRPPTYMQVRQRLAWRAAAWAWTALSDSEKAKWTACATANHLRVTGFNLFIYVTSTGKTECLASLKQSPA